jgi:hypothetical protein
MDVGLPAPLPSGINFMPSSPLPQPGGVQPWPEDLNLKFMAIVCQNKKTTLLTSIKRQDYRFYLNNRTATSQAQDKAKR